MTNYLPNRGTKILELEPWPQFWPQNLETWHGNSHLPKWLVKIIKSSIKGSRVKTVVLALVSKFMYLYLANKLSFVGFPLSKLEHICFSQGKGGRGWGMIILNNLTTRIKCCPYFIKGIIHEIFRIFFFNTKKFSRLN